MSILELYPQVLQPLCPLPSSRSQVDSNIASDAEPANSADTFSGYAPQRSTQHGPLPSGRTNQQDSPAYPARN